MIVVSDSSPITSLIRIDRLNLLEALFKHVLVPAAVYGELTRTHSDLPRFIQVSTASNRDVIRRLQSKLDLGEAEAIALALEMNADVLLIDERRGRIVAEKEGLKITGLLGVLVEAKSQRLISSVRLVISDLEKRAGFRLSKTVKAEALRFVQEESN